MNNTNIINVLEKAVEGDLLSQAFITSVIAYAASENDEWQGFDATEYNAKLVASQFVKYFEAMIEATKEVGEIGGFEHILESVLKYTNDD